MNERPTNIEAEANTLARLITAAKLITGAEVVHPGFLSVNENGINYAFGNVNGPISYDYGPADDPGATREGGSTILPADSSAEAIIQFVETVLATVPPRFNHTFDFAFEVPNSLYEDGSCEDAEVIRAACIERITRLPAAEIHEACGNFDTHEEELHTPISTPEKMKSTTTEAGVRVFCTIVWDTPSLVYLPSKVIFQPQNVSPFDRKVDVGTVRKYLVDTYCCQIKTLDFYVVVAPGMSTSSQLQGE